MADDDSTTADHVDLATIRFGPGASPRLPSAADLEIAVHAALSAHDVAAAVGLLRLMVPQDPRRAARLYDLLVIALEIAKAESAPAVGRDEQYGGDIRGSANTGP